MISSRGGEGSHDKKDNMQYPICLAGKRACPPEDVGSIPGYYDFLEVINNPKHEAYKSMLSWIGGKYDAEKFDPQTVKFDNPNIRRLILFSNYSWIGTNLLYDALR